MARDQVSLIWRLAKAKVIEIHRQSYGSPIMSVVNNAKTTIIGCKNFGHENSPREHGAWSPRFPLMRALVSASWKVTTLAIGLAILAGMYANSTTPLPNLAVDESNLVRAEPAEYGYRILTRLPKDKASIQLEVVDPGGRSAIVMSLGAEGKNYMFSKANPEINFGYVFPYNGKDLMHVFFGRTRFTFESKHDGTTHVVHREIDQQGGEMILNQFLIAPKPNRSTSDPQEP